MKSRSAGMCCLIFLMLLPACRSTVITHSWINPEWSRRPINNLLIVCLSDDKDRAMREQMEAHLCEDLERKNIVARSSLVTFGPTLFEGLTEQQALEQLRKKNADAVLMMVLLDKEKERYYVPDRIYYTPFTVYHRHFWGYYHLMYGRIYEPGYYAENTNYFWECNLYDLQTNRIVYSVQTRSFDPSSAYVAAHEYGRLISNDLTEKGLLSIP